MATSDMHHLIPLPVSVTPGGETFSLTDTTGIYVGAAQAEAAAIAHYLADAFRPATGYELPVITAVEAPDSDSIELVTGGDSALGDEGYELTITPTTIRLMAAQPAGLFYGVQTLRQLLPPGIEGNTVQPGPWPITTGTIRDYPRFGWRGSMLDVSRHFFTVEQVKHYLDLLARYKINRLHLHLSDDQGWRLMINSWPKLAEVGGSSEVGGGPGGYYTQAEYADIIAYAQSRYIMIIPEIDLPGHTNAALASYPELNGNDEAPALYTGIEVGFSSLCIDKEITYTFLNDVIGEIAAITPGPYIHIGGDEAAATPPDDYLKFMNRVQPIVQAHGKQMIGWEEVARADLDATTIVQFWNGYLGEMIAQKGLKVIMSPASLAYLDMQYTEDSPLGLHWAAYINVERGYDWEPTAVVDGLTEDQILGVEAPLWSETLETTADIEYMAFPRLPGYAEIGWSPAAGRGWAEYRGRLGAQGPRFRAMGINFFASPLVPWE